MAIKSYYKYDSLETSKKIKIGIAFSVIGLFGLIVRLNWFNLYN